MTTIGRITGSPEWVADSGDVIATAEVVATRLVKSFRVAGSIVGLEQEKKVYGGKEMKEGKP